MKLYLAGPMTGLPKFNFPLFFEVAHVLRDQGHEVANPAEHDLNTVPALAYEPGYATGNVSKTRLFDARAAFMWDFAQILDAHAIALLPGWEGSVGARMERAVAEKTGKLVMLCVERAVQNKPYSNDVTERWTMKPDPEQIRMSCIVAEEDPR